MAHHGYNWGSGGLRLLEFGLNLEPKASIYASPCTVFVSVIYVGAKGAKLFRDLTAFRKSV